jgi:hypothetical protein
MASPEEQPSLPHFDESEGAARGSAKEPLQIRIPINVKRRFKAHAAMRGMEPNELFVEVWDHYERTRATDSGRQGE